MEDAVLDYATHYAVLRTIEDVAAKVVGTTPTLSQAIQITKSNQAQAALGSVLSKLFEHTGSTDVEIGILDQASKAWSSLHVFLDQVEKMRTTLESLVINPQQPNATKLAADIANQVNKVFPPQATALKAQFDGLTADLKVLAYLPTPLRQAGKPSNEWLWRDIVRGRRSGAFRRAIVAQAQADGEADLMAFAYGSLADYAANLCGHPYLNEVVGGPPRMHPYRSRVAANSIGAQLLGMLPSSTLDAAGLLKVLTAGSPTLPPQISALLGKAVTSAYGPGGPPPPDMSRAFATMVRHLTLISSFQPLPVPKPVSAPVTKAMMVASPGVSPQGGGAGTGGTYPNPQGGNTGGGASGGGKGKSIWALIFAIFSSAAAIACCIFLPPVCAATIASAVLAWAGYFTSDKANPSSAEFQQTSYQLVNYYFSANCQLYQAAQALLQLLKFGGLVPPEQSDLNSSDLSQFLKLEKHEQYPHRPMADPMDFFIYPTSAIENPKQSASLVPGGQGPNAFLHPISANTLTAEAVGIGFWKDLHLSELARENLDLDADRAVQDQCWTTKPGTTLVQDPVVVQQLPYDVAWK